MLVHSFLFLLCGMVDTWQQMRSKLELNHTLYCSVQNQAKVEHDVAYLPSTMKTINLVRLNLVYLGKAAVQLKLKDVPQARQGSCALLAVCNTTSAGGLKLEQVVSSNHGQVGTCHLLALEYRPAYARYRIWVLCFKLQLDWECCSVDILLLCCPKSITQSSCSLKHNIQILYLAYAGRQSGTRR